MWGEYAVFSNNLITFVEHIVYSRRYFRCSKAYYLGNRTPGEDFDSVVRLRVRSIPQRLHGTLGPRHFGQNPLTNAAVVRGVSMLPTAGFQVVMASMGRTLARALNLKRQMTVSMCGGKQGRWWWQKRQRSGVIAFTTPSFPPHVL